MIISPHGPAGITAAMHGDAHNDQRPPGGRDISTPLMLLPSFVIVNKAQQHELATHRQCRRQFATASNCNPAGVNRMTFCSTSRRNQVRAARLMF
jgi:hypothetical protein